MYEQIHINLVRLRVTIHGKIEQNRKYFQFNLCKIYLNTIQFLGGAF